MISGPKLEVFPNRPRCCTARAGTTDRHSEGQELRRGCGVLSSERLRVSTDRSCLEADPNGRKYPTSRGGQSGRRRVPEHASDSQSVRILSLRSRPSTQHGEVADVQRCPTDVAELGPGIRPVGGPARRAASPRLRPATPSLDGRRAVSRDRRSAGQRQLGRASAHRPTLLSGGQV